MRGTRVFLFLLCLCGYLAAHDFVLGDRGLLSPSTQAAINSVASELLGKTKISAYVVIKDAIKDQMPSSKTDRERFIHQVLRDLPKPYFVLFFIKQDKKINFYVSDDIKDRVDLEGIYQKYMVPLLPLSQKEILDVSRISAIVLNGYVHFADALAKSYGKEVASTLIDRNGDLLAYFARLVMIGMIVVLVALFVYTRIRRKQ